MVALQVLSNGLGMMMVGLYFVFLLPDSSLQELGPRRVNYAVFGIWIALMLVLAVPVNTVFLRKAVAWVPERREPTAAERKVLFSLPAAETMSALVSWLIGAVMFGWINEEVAHTAVGIVMAGIVTCAMLYLLLEGYFRPLFALALRSAPVPRDRRDVFPRLMFAWMLGSAVPMLAIGLTASIHPEDIAADRLGWITIVSALAGGIVMALAARSVLRPIRRIRDGLRAVEIGDFDVNLPVDDLGELGRLTEGVNHLAAGLKEREQLRDTFEKQVGEAGLADLVLEGEEPTRVGELREVTVLFVDLTGYTGYAQRMPPEEVVDMLNQFFGVVVAVVNREGGWINKFEGDAALCIFGAPRDQPDHALRGLRAASSIPIELDRLGGTLSARIGLSTGEVLAGFIGSQERHEYTVIGDVVNVAARLCDVAREQTSGVLADASTIDAVQAADGWKRAGRVEIKGRTGKTFAYTLDGSKDTGNRRTLLRWIPLRT